MMSEYRRLLDRDRDPRVSRVIIPVIDMEGRLFYKIYHRGVDRWRLYSVFYD